MVRLVIVGVDGSARAAAASEWAARLTVRTGAQLVVAFAWHARQAEGTREDFADRCAAAEALLEGAWCEPARAAGADPRASFSQGFAGLLEQCAPLVDAHLQATADATPPATVAELLDISDHGVAVDERHAYEQPDWSYETSWGGETPVERFVDHRARTELKSACRR